MLLYSTSSFDALTGLHTYSINRPMSMLFRKTAKLRFPKPPLSYSYPKVINGDTHFHHKNLDKNANFTVRASSKAPTPTPTPPPLPQVTTSNNKLIIISSAITVALAIANRVLYKLALVPMKRYPFFLAQFITFGYVVIYFSILYVRYRAGIVTNEMISIPKLRFVAIGILEALGVATGMAAAAMIPGPAIPILNQTFLVWQLAFSALLLGRRYSFNQISGCFLVAIGVVVAVSSGSNADQMLSGVEFIWPALMIISSAFQAGASIIKEFIFVDAAKLLKGKSLDIFVVNSFGSGFQALFVVLLLPLLSNLKGIPFAQLPSYLKSGAGCLVNIGRNVPVPISIYVLSLPLPYLPEGSGLSPFFLLGSMILVLGLVLYNVARPGKQASN
ncbi:protein CLT2, chloroplastic isoform X2 [Ricinus communis]|uniref:protein CLT2, chloroplastic isoform X2 n=1 Tax=Ricinus communis TaxID=3988 RepID=UPI00201AF0C0|nr:protein CLT2, chloroplastic isoform X2 [Ricinus communis]